MTDSSASFFCPITHALMVDPVTDPDGNSFEKHAIEEWIRQNGTSPITRAALSAKNLAPNRALKAAIDEYRQSVPSDLQSEIQSNSVPVNVQSSDLTAFGNYANGFLHISIQPPQAESRSPCDICCVVDVSGSMSDRAEIQNDKNEQFGLTQLDLVKHALKTIINSLQSQDRLSIVSFSDKATVLSQLTRMDHKGKNNALAAVDNLSVSKSFENVQNITTQLSENTTAALFLTQITKKYTKSRLQDEKKILRNISYEYR